MITIEHVNSRLSKKSFIDFPVSIYGSDTKWIRPLNVVVSDAINFKNNPFYLNGKGSAFLAKKDGRYAGRILAHISTRHQRLHKEQICYFGLFECIDDIEAAKSLFTEAENFARENNCNIVRGPFNITAAQEIGIVTDGFNNMPAIDMVYTAQWYPALLEKSGYHACLAMQTWQNNEINKLSPNETANNLLVSKNNITCRHLNFWHRSSDLERVREIVNSAFLGNWNFVPITQEEWKLQVGALIPFLDPELIIIAEYQGIAVGVTFAVPDFNKVLRFVNGKIFHPAILALLKPNSVKNAAVILFAVRKQFQNMGISRMLNTNLVQNLQKKNYEGLSITWVAEGNIGSESQAKTLGMKTLHKLAMFEKKL